MNTLATGLYSNLEQLEINLRQRLIDAGLLLGSVAQDDLFPSATDETNWLVARCIYKLAHPTYVWAYQDSSWINSMEVAVITNQTNNASTTNLSTLSYQIGATVSALIKTKTHLKLNWQSIFCGIHITRRMSFYPLF